MLLDLPRTVVRFQCFTPAPCCLQRPSIAAWKKQHACAPPDSNKIFSGLIARAEATDLGPPSGDVGEESEAEQLQKLDIRVGRITSITEHAEADELYVEQIDVGEIEPRTIVSGLRKYSKAEDLEGELVLVLCNLPPRKMRGIPSAGMLLCASNAKHTVVEPLAPPQQAQPGDRVFFGQELSSQFEPATSNQMKKKKIWESFQPSLRTDGNGVPNFKGLPMLTQAGAVQSTLSDAAIS